jgi:hypothetical protein
VSLLIRAIRDAPLTRYRAYQDLCYLVEKYAPASQATPENTENVEASTQVEKLESVDVDKGPVPKSEVPPSVTITTTEEPTIIADNQDAKAVMNPVSQDLGSAEAHNTEPSSKASEAKENDPAVGPRNNPIEPELEASKACEAKESDPAIGPGNNLVGPELEASQRSGAEDAVLPKLERHDSMFGLS